MTTKQKIKFNKFFPEDSSFVSVDGYYNDVKDWWVDLTLQTDLRNYSKVSIFDHKPQEAIKQLKAYVEAAEKAIAFAEKCMAMKPAKITVGKKK